MVLTRVTRSPLVTRALMALAMGFCLVAAPETQRTVTLFGRVDVRLPPPSDARPDIRDHGARRHAPIDGRRSVVYFEAAPRSAFEATGERRARLDQRDETFVPHVLAVTVGTTVEFPNSDPTFHNVFSLSRAKSFDLGRYAEGRSKSVVFDRPGIVRVFCDIHSHMNAWILVFAHKFFAVTNAEGRYRIDGVPAGSYTISVWNESAAKESREITIPAGAESLEMNFTLAREKATR